MKCVPALALVLTLILAGGCSQTQKSVQEPEKVSVALVEKRDEQRVDVLVNGKLFTAYRWPDDVYKPILFPLISPGGAPVTRGFPLEPREGERNDHRHQTGNWLNYGNVNGFDFWGNGHNGQKEPNGGVIRHVSVENLSEGDGKASMVTHSLWQDPQGRTILAERTEYHFAADASSRIMDRITTLTASQDGSVHFKDTKEGMFGIRVARQLELPEEESNADGATVKPSASNAVTTGNYRSSEGISGEKVWGTRARWMDLTGRISGEEISLVIFDHPKNVNYPTYWHARAYGLFAANPLGVRDFTNGSEELNYTLQAGDSVTFRYRILLASQHLSDDDINTTADEFAGKY